MILPPVGTRRRQLKEGGPSGASLFSVFLDHVALIPSIRNDLASVDVGWTGGMGCRFLT